MGAETTGAQEKAGVENAGAETADARFTLVTGACGGLGGAFVELLAERGEPLFLSGRSSERLALLAQNLHEKYPALPVKYCACDLTDGESRAALFAYCDEEKIALGRLVYVAGVDTQMAFEKYDEARIVFQTRVNLEGAVSLINGFLRRAALDGDTEILCVGSMSAITPMPYFALYSATKKGLEQFCGGLRTELKGKAKVTCVLPGGIPTRDDIKQNIEEHGFWGRVSAKSPRAVAEASLKAVHRNKRKKIVGFWNKVIRFFSSLAPMPLRLKVIAKMWKGTEKDHFGGK